MKMPKELEQIRQTLIEHECGPKYTFNRCFEAMSKTHVPLAEVYVLLELVKAYERATDEGFYCSEQENLRDAIEAFEKSKESK